MDSIHIMNREDDQLQEFQQQSSYIDLSNMHTICFKKMFKDIVTSELFTIEEVEYIGDIKVKEDKVIYHLNEEEVSLMYNLMEGDIHHHKTGREIVEMLTCIWESNQQFQELSYLYYLTDDKSELEDTLKIFYNYNNTIKIDSVWNFYRYKITEMYQPIKNKILNLYMEDVFQTKDHFRYNVNGKDSNLISVVFHDKKYQPEVFIL